MLNAISSSHGLSDAEISAVRAPLEEAALLPARVYDEERIFQLERERLFARSWMPVCHISQIEEPGDYVARTLVGESVVALRGKGGEIRVLSNVCRHRNMMLVQGTGRVKGGRVTCPYHGWTYGLEGNLLAAPFMEQTGHFVRRDIALPEFRFEVWHGFVFVNLEGNARPVAEQLAEFEPYIAPYKFEEKELFEMRRTRVEWNWKVSLENFSEAYHQPWVHASTAEPAFPAKLAEYLDTNHKFSVFLLRQEGHRQLETFGPVDPDMPEDFLKKVTVANIYPYLHMLVDPTTPLFLDFDIRGVRDHDLVWSLLLPKGSKKDPNIREHVKTFEGFIAPVLAEDVEICRGVSLAVSSRASGQGRLSWMERSVHQFHNWWLDAMNVA